MKANGGTPLPIPKGFRFSAVPAGIKASGRPDLALVECSAGTRAAAVFTRNRVAAAPVLVGRDALKTGRGEVRAVIVNSGNANCATGNAGLAACRKVCSETARQLGAAAESVFPSSTGIIGVRFPVNKIVGRLAELVRGAEASERAALGFAGAILTTDTRRKTASAAFSIGGRRVALLGVAKGSGMIHPQLATMLVYLFTDLSASAAGLKRRLRRTCDETFNCISVDGDTSTNDTVLLLASGQSGVKLGDAAAAQLFELALKKVCRSLAQQIVSDGEGVKHVIELRVEQARTRAEALQVARTVAHSALAKTAWAGADPNWGRILAAVGRSGVALDPGRVDIFIGKQRVCRRGAAHAFDERAAHQHLSQPGCDIRILLGRGRSHALFLTTDLTAEYVRINADYST